MAWDEAYAYAQGFFEIKLKWDETSVWYASMNRTYPRTNLHVRTFRPFIPQLRPTDELAEHKGPVRVAFAWAVRHQVTGRDERGNVTSVNTKNMLSAPRMKFQSPDHYVRWHEDAEDWQDDEHDLDHDQPEDGVPDWMYDMADEQSFPTH